MAKMTTFDDWTDYFRQWQRDIGLDTAKIGDYKFDVKFGAVPSDTIEFGDYAGRPKWETVLQIPDQRVRDSLRKGVVYGLAGVISAGDAVVGAARGAVDEAQSVRGSNGRGASRKTATAKT